MVSKVPGNSEPIDVRALSNLPPIQNQDSKPSVPIISVPEGDVAKSEQTLKHSAGLIAGIVVLGVALAVVAVALTVLAPGVPQAIVLAIAFSGLSVGGVTTLRSLINGVRTLVAPKMTVKQRAKSAALLGAGLTGAGLVLKLGSSYVPGGYGSALGKFGDISYGRGSGAFFAGFAHYLYVHFFQSKKAAAGAELTPEEMLIEGAKLRKITRGLIWFCFFRDFFSCGWDACCDWGSGDSSYRSSASLDQLGHFFDYFQHVAYNVGSMASLCKGSTRTRFTWGY